MLRSSVHNVHTNYIGWMRCQDLAAATFRLRQQPTLFARLVTSLDHDSVLYLHTHVHTQYWSK